MALVRLASSLRNLIEYSFSVLRMERKQLERVLVIFRNGPYGLINSLEGIRVVQGLLILDVETDAIFIDDGVFNLIKDQDPEGIGHHSIEGAVKALHNYGVPIFAVTAKSAANAEDDARIPISMTTQMTLNSFLAFLISFLLNGLHLI